MARLQIELQQEAPPPLVERVAATAGYAGAEPAVTTMVSMLVERYPTLLGRVRGQR